MNFMWVNVLVICCGLRGVVAAQPDGYIGCYPFMYSDQNTNFPNKSGCICKDFCFPQYRYAGTSFKRCYCMKRLNGQPTMDCTAECPDRTFQWEICGGIQRMTVYDAQKTTLTHSSTTSTSSSTLKTSTTPGVTSTVNSTSVKTHSTTNPLVSTDETTKYFSNDTTTESISGKGDGALPPNIVKIIIIVGIYIVLVTIAVCAVLLARRLRRKRLKRSRTRTGPQDGVNNAYVGHCGDGGVTSGQDDLETEYDTTTTTWRPKPRPSSAEDDYSRLKMPGGRIEDPTYSHMRNNQLGACADLGGEYSYLDRTEGCNKWTSNAKSNTAANDYDSVQFNTPMNVRLVRRAGLQPGVSNDDVYDKLQNKF